jgi:flagellar protein FlgJ
MNKQEIFVAAYYDAAIETQINFKVPHLVTLGQAALESGWGKSAPGNNFFGIKAFKSWTGPKQMLDTYEFKDGVRIKVKAAFRLYDTPYDSFVDHADTLKKRFPVAFQYQNNPEEFIRSVQRDHQYKYATDPDYAKKIISIMALIKQIVNDLKLNNKSKEVNKC